MVFDFGRIFLRFWMIFFFVFAVFNTPECPLLYVLSKNLLNIFTVNKMLVLVHSRVLKNAKKCRQEQIVFQLNVFCVK